jgi:hypothetical protein
MVANGKLTDGYKKQVEAVMEATQFTYEEVVAMIKMCDGDPNMATEKLLESEIPLKPG